MWSKDRIDEIYLKQQAFFRTNVTLDVAWRKKQLKKLYKIVCDNEDKIAEALYEDLGRHEAEAYLLDVGVIKLEISEILHHINKWARKERHYSGLICFPSIRTEVLKLPYGNCLLISPYNFPFLLAFGVLASCIAAGNTAIIKTSSRSKESSLLMRKLINDNFDEAYISVIDCDHDLADYLLEKPFDKIFYTGSPQVGKKVLHKAADNLTSVALELGGENGNWCLLRKDCDIEDAARKIAFFKICNSGQICIDINQVAVPEEIAEDFIAALKKEFDRQLPDALHNDEYCHLIDKKAYDKAINWCQKYEDKIIYGGHGDSNSLKFEPTIIYPLSINDDIVQNELFCPLLPIVTYEDDRWQEIVDIIESRQHGLAFYVFTKDVKWAENLLSRMQFGGACVNEVCLHHMVKGVPFNGVGHSGLGAYHGEWGFREFSHPSTVLYGKSHFNLSLREHPYNRIKLLLLKLFEK